MSQASFAHAAKALRKADADRYFATLVLPVDRREGVAALYAFNAEIAAIRERVSNPAAGEIRLQWWNDALSGEEHGAVRQNPVADALLGTIAQYQLPVGTLQRLLGARRFDLYDDPMPDVPTFEGYAGETASTLYQLAAMIVNGGGQVPSGDAAGHLGVAQAMIGHLRAFGYHASQSRIMLPWSIFAANGVRESEIFSGVESEGLHEALGQISELAGEHLEKAELAIGAVPAHLRAVFAPVSLLRSQLDAYQSRGTSPYAAPPLEADWRKIARLMWWGISRCR